MANISNPNGFVPLRMQGGGDWRGVVKTYYVPSSDGTAIYVGDVVKFNGSTGAAGLSIYGHNCEGLRQVVRVATGATGQDIAGVVVGFSPDPDAQMNKYRAANTNRLVRVCPVEGVIFEVQEDAVGTPIAGASVGLVFPFTTTAGSTLTGISAMAIDSSDTNNTATFPIKVIALVPRVGNGLNTAGAGSDPARFEVVFNTSYFAPNIAGV